MTELTLDVYTNALYELPNGGMFSPTTSTLICGPTEALLVDTQFLQPDVDEVIKRVRASGKDLTTIFITHGHFDHYFGLDALLAEFPDARPVAVASVATSISAGLDTERGLAKSFFEGKALDNTTVPQPLETSTLHVDGAEVRVIEIEQADIAPTAIVHIPSLDAVIAGDAIYNGVNPFLAVSGPREWAKWIASVEQIAALDPAIVVAGHKRPELPDRAEAIAETHQFLTQFVDNLATSSNSRELVARMQELFPDHANASALVMSAVTAFKHKKAGN